MRGKSVLEKVLKRRITKNFAESYEVVSSRKGFRDFIILFPNTELDPIIDDYYTVADRLEKKKIFFSVYPMPIDEPKIKERFLKSNPIIKEVIL